ncbi:activating signal cointegrator 1 [Phymastichus coffea]|uniref:activating signal cointegrator 1 n=1 Tax=Phymastichus coffea TaxID=108790 RepID=UPI00273CC90A|nr:activating signal cointegrator 1 [Phymastichus coffea]
MERRRKSNNQRGKKSFKNQSTLSDEKARNLCDCEATKHPLINNCINCGRIVCLSEGPGPCFFCGHSVNYYNTTAPLSNLNKNSDKMQKFPYDEIVIPEEESETLKLRNKLLEFDKNCASRTSVIDDECDYYQANNLWLTKQQREQWKKLEQNIQQEKHKSRLHQKISVDFTGRVITEENPLEIYNKMNSIDDCRNFESLCNAHSSNFELSKGPIYVDNDSLSSNYVNRDNDIHINRVQDKGILEICDQGVCLSMHQPYASLLVRGIKKTEGRTWYSSHRGRLWIASGTKKPSTEEIKFVEDMYRHTSKEEIQFPKSYPTGCLLGCITVTDVLSQEEYNKFYPEDKVSSPYIFICEKHFELPIKYPIQGKHKIYKLDSVIHRAALNCLEKTCLEMSKNT